ncbi:hypothetical protein MPLSOD_280043 [Mesorhizobium sp. SOD10]|nr:hypothetical protein MPLSOD_280043 [Mesorhizobium sp. SOD10]
MPESNTLADGSPTRFLRILSYGLANPMIKRMTDRRAVSRDGVRRSIRGRLGCWRPSR